MNADDRVLQVLQQAGEPLSAGKIAEISGLERKEVDRAMALLKKEERILSPRRCFWVPA